MRHFHRTHIPAARVLQIADEFFPTLALERSASGERSRTFKGTLGSFVMTVRAEGGHYTLIDVVTDQMGESRLDRNVKRFFVQVHRAADPSHELQAAY